MLRRHIMFLGLCTLAFACKSSKPEAEAVAKVNGEVITKQEFTDQVERNMARYRGQSHQLPPGIEQRIQESVLRRMIDDEVIEQKAKAMGITVTDAEIEQKFKEHKDRFRTDQAFDDYLKRSNNTEANMKADLKRNLLRDRVVEQLSGNIDVTEEEIAKYYAENEARFRDKEQVRASRILVKIGGNGTDADKKAAMKEAKRIHGLVSKSGADFAAIAKEQSKGPEASRGGELGWFARGRMPPEFDEVAFKLGENKTSDVVETKLGYEIIKVWEKKPERQRPLEEVKENIKSSLLARVRNEKRRDVLRNLKAEAKVEQILKFDQPPATTTPPRAAATPTEGAPGTAPGGEMAAEPGDNVDSAQQ